MWWVVNATPQPLTSRKETRYSLYKRVVGPQGRSGRVWKISPPAGFNPRTVQPVASSYTDWAIAAPCNVRNCRKNRCGKNRSFLVFVNEELLLGVHAETACCFESEVQRGKFCDLPQGVQHMQSCYMCQGTALCLYVFTALWRKWDKVPRLGASQPPWQWRRPWMSGRFTPDKRTPNFFL